MSEAMAKVAALDRLHVLSGMRIAFKAISMLRSVVVSMPLLMHMLCPHAIHCDAMFMLCLVCCSIIGSGGSKCLGLALPVSL